MHPDYDPYSAPQPPPGSWPPGPGQPVPRNGTNPWFLTIGAAVVGFALIAVLLATGGGGGGSTPSAFDDPGGAGPVTALPTMPDLSGFPTAPPTGRRSTPPSTGSGSTGPTAAPSTTGPNPVDRADTDKHPFTPAEWFPELGDTSIQKRPYKQLQQDSASCQTAEAGLRSLIGSDCLGIVRSVWTEPTHTYVGALSVVSLPDKTTAESLSRRLASGASNGAYVTFIQPPSGSGVKFSEQSRTWVGTRAAGHYLVIIEVGRSDGKDAGDAGSKQMYSDLNFVATDHIVSWIWE